MPPNVAIENLLVTILSTFFSWLLMFGIVRVKYVGLCNKIQIRNLWLIPF